MKRDDALMGREIFHTRDGIVAYAASFRLDQEDLDLAPRRTYPRFIAVAFSQGETLVDLVSMLDEALPCSTVCTPFMSQDFALPVCRLDKETMLIFDGLTWEKFASLAREALEVLRKEWIGA